MFLIAAFFLSFCGLAACLDASHAGVSSEGSVWNTDLIETLVKRVDMLEARDLQHQQQMVAVQKKLKRQDQEILTLRMLLSNRNKEPIQDREKESVDIEEKSEESTAGIQIRSEKQAVVKSIAAAPKNYEGGISTVSSVSETQADVQRIRRQEVDMNVAFLAILVNDIHHLGQNQNVAFEHVVTNEGNAYHPNAGLFIAPVPGTYVFSTTITTIARDNAHYGFALNGNVLTTLWVDGVEKYYDSSAQTIVLQLQKGDEVSVKHTEIDKSITGRNHSLFSGFLLRQSFGSASVVG